MRLRPRSAGTAWEARPAGEGGSATPGLGGGSLPFPPGSRRAERYWSPLPLRGDRSATPLPTRVLAPALACFPLAGAGPPALEVTRVGELPQSFQRRDRLLGSALAGRNPRAQAPGGAVSDARFCPPQPAAALRGAGRLPPGRPNPAVMGCGKPGRRSSPAAAASWPSVARGSRSPRPGVRGPCSLKPGGRWQVFASPRIWCSGSRAGPGGSCAPGEGEWAPADVLAGCFAQGGCPGSGRGPAGEGCANASQKGERCLRGWKLT